jgi:hypothetical protein
MVKLYKIELLHVHYAPHAYAGYMAKQMLKDEGINTNGNTEQIYT